jgi:NitT/TauT family transport system substrate-binding protein
MISFILRLACLAVVYFSLVATARAESRRMDVAIPSFGDTAIFQIALAKGFYKQEDLDVNLILMRNTVAILALIGGNVHIATVAGSALPPILRGTPLKFTFTTYERSAFAIYAKPEIRHIKELKGKKIVIAGGIGSGADSQLRLILKRYGLEGGRDVLIVGTNGSSEAYQIFRAGAADSVVVSPQNGIMLSNEGFPTLTTYAKEGTTQLQGSIVMPAQLLKAEPALAERFIRGTLKGFLYARDNRNEAVRIYSQNNNLDEKTGGQIYDLRAEGMTKDGIASEAAQKRSVEEVLERVAVKAVPPLETIYDYSLLRKIHAELKAKGWKPGK